VKRIRVVVVDDSAYNRRTITKLLEELPEVEVAGYATDGEEGIRRVIDLKPDLVTLDLEMPRMDGFTFLRILMNTCPTPVIVISAQSADERVFKALELGAVDFVAKPTNPISEELLKIRENLHDKVRSVFNLTMARVRLRESSAAEAGSSERKRRMVTLRALPNGRPRAEVVAIGASTGGPPALQKILNELPENLPFAVVVAQHMPGGFTKAFAERLNRSVAFEVKEAHHGDRVESGRVLIAPGGKNMTFQISEGNVVVCLEDPRPEDRFIPSVNSLFASLAPLYGRRLLALVLTGMGDDGRRGVKVVKDAGGQVLAEAEESAVVFGMPREAIATGLVDRVSHLDLMAREIIQRCGILPDSD
jgi:two-component system chemotaxis response regulator CheB